MAMITDDDLKMFQERSKTEFASRCDTGGIAWDSVIWDLCNEVRKLRSGDCAKLREALVKCREIALQWQADEAAGVAGTTDKPHARSAAEAVIDMEFEINAALSAPPRNCDMYANHNDAMKAFEAFVREQGKLGFINPYTEAFKWLFATATEGGNNGNE